MKVYNPDESQEDRAVIRVVQSENILLHFHRRGHADDGAVPPSAAEGVDTLFIYQIESGQRCLS